MRSLLVVSGGTALGQAVINKFLLRGAAWRILNIGNTPVKQATHNLSINWAENIEKQLAHLHAEIKTFSSQ
jgi:hypothetical protein